MTDNRLREKYTVAALFHTIAEGVEFDRGRWPAHVTLVSNFVTDADLADLVAAVRGADALTGPLAVEFAGSALFGPDRDVPVQLVRPTRLALTHERLADRIESLSGFAADVPAYWRNGYRPHVTLFPGLAVSEGAQRVVQCVVIARLSGTAATVVAAFEVPD